MVYNYRPVGADIIGLLILAFLLFLIKHNDFMDKKKIRHFYLVTAMTMFIIVLEIISNVLDSNITGNTRTAANLVNVFGFSLMFYLPVLLGRLYCDDILKHKVICLLPAYVGTVLSISSIWTGWIFWIDETGKYQRGSLFFVNTAICLIGFLIFLYANIKKAKEYDDSERAYLRMIYVIVLFVTIVQIVDSRLVIMWGGIATSELLYYIFLRELHLKYDVVTNLRNRACFEKNLLEVHKDESLFLVVFDVNDLKHINDTYGHEKGDRYLSETAKIFKKCYEKHGIIYRIGGDEFAVIAPGCTEEKIQAARKQMLEMVEETRQTWFPEFYIANAYCQYNSSLFNSIQECFNEADSRMYEDKKRSKLAGECI